MECCARLVKSNALALVLTAVTTALVCLLFATDRRLGLHQFASTRYRFHAIPVAISTLHNNRPHDYTAMRYMAMRFQNTDENLDDQIRRATAADADIGGGTYFWVADDRGLADYVIAAFWLFGPETVSLSNFYFLLLGLSLTLYTIGFWRTPAALVLPLCVMATWLGIAQVMQVRLPMQFQNGWWGEEIALYESRMFDVLALVSVLHLGIVAGTGPRLSRLACVTAAAQAAQLVFLYHARSSIGWQYLALFSLVAMRLCWCTAQRTRSVDPPPVTALARPLFVAGILAVSLVALKQYQRAVYHPDYLHDYGQRTFWHNALMGLAYHPRLRDELPMALCDDRNAAEVVLRRMEERDPGLDKNQWNWQAALNSLGNHNPFGWDRYEQTARDFYLELWRTRPKQMAKCHTYYKPMDIARQARLLASRLWTGTINGRTLELVVGLLLMAPAFASTIVVARRDPELRVRLRSLSRVVAFLIPFSLIPGIAFYPALTTVACFFLLSATLLNLMALRIVAHTFSSRRQ
jgi:hypothetical protein